MSFDRQYPAHHVTEFATRLEAGGVDELWVIEDCFYTAGVSLASAALTSTEKLTVGIGILPARARTAAVTAMEFATLCALAPGRVLPGIGHGVQSWMAQMGVRPSSPLRALDEVIVAVRRLLAGDEVSVDGEYVYLDQVQLDQPPLVPPPVLAGVRRAKSLAIAGASADGVVLDATNPANVAWSLEQAGKPSPFHVAAFAVLCVQETRSEAYRVMAQWLGEQIGSQDPNLTTLPFFDDLKAWHSEKGDAGLTSIPPEWWAQIAPVGTFDDAVAYISAMEEAGVHSLGLWSAPDVSIGLADIDVVTRLKSATR